MELTKHIEQIEKALIKEKPELVCLALKDKGKREEIKKHILEKYSYIATDETTAEIITREIVGTGIIEKIIDENKDVTDIAFDGDTLTAVGVNYYEEFIGVIDGVYVERIIQKFAAAMKKEFTPNTPRLNGVYKFFRIQALHGSNTSNGIPTFSLRIVQPQLALNSDNFEQFAPNFILDFYRVCMEIYCNTLISGRTGTGKTELQKLGVSYMNGLKDKIGIIQDVPEMFAKELFPNKKGIYEWLTGNGVTHNDLITDAMRNNFTWILVSETRNGSAYALWQAALSDHFVVTTLHAKGALNILKRMAQLAKFAPEAATMQIEYLEEQIELLIDFGWHIDKETIGNRDFRFLKEIASYEPNNSKLFFEQYFEDGKLHYKTGELPAWFKTEIKRKKIMLDFPENSTGSIELRGVTI